MKIKVTPEGRENIWNVTDKESLKGYIKSLGFDTIHNFIPSGFMMIGADHGIESVMEDIDKAERLAVFTDGSNVGHALAVIIDNKLECFDIGTLTVDNLDIYEGDKDNTSEESSSEEEAGSGETSSEEVSS